MREGREAKVHMANVIELEYNNSYKNNNRLSNRNKSQMYGLFVEFPPTHTYPQLNLRIFLTYHTYGQISNETVISYKNKDSGAVVNDLIC